MEGSKFLVGELKIVSDKKSKEGVGDSYDIAVFRDKMWIYDGELSQEQESDVEKTVGSVYDESDLEYSHPLHYPEMILGKVTQKGLTKQLYLFGGDPENLDPKTAIQVKKIVKQLGIDTIVAGSNFENQEDIYTPRSEVTGRVPKYVYHGTSVEHLRSILKSGLLPIEYGAIQKRKVNTNFHVNNEDRVFFTSSFDKAAFYANNAAINTGYEPMILKLEIPDPSKLTSDYDAWSWTNRKHREYDATYDSQDITPNTDGGLRRSAMGVTQDLGKWGYKGRIPNSFIKVYYIPEFHSYPTLAYSMKDEDIEPKYFRHQRKKNMLKYLWTVEELEYEFGDPDFDMKKYEEMDKYGWVPDHGTNYEEFSEWYWNNDVENKWVEWESLSDDEKDEYQDFYDFVEGFDHLNESQLLQEEYLSTDYVMGFELEGYVPAVEDRVYFYYDHPSTLAIENDMIDIFGKTSKFPKMVDDASLSRTNSEKTSFELASTPIPVNPSNLSKIKKYLSHIQDAYGFYTDDRCGFHTHVTWPGVNPAEMAWILMQLSVDKSAREILKSVNDQIYFYNERYANDDELKQIISLMQRGYSNVEEFVKKIEFFIGDKWSGFHAHSSNTLEWRAPRGFIGTVDGISLYLKKFVYFLQKLSKYLSNDEFVMPSGLKVTKRGVQEVFDKIAAGSGDHSLRPSLPGREWKTDKDREKELKKKILDKVEIFKEKGLSKLDIYKRFNKLADKFPVTRRFLQDRIGGIDADGLSLEDLLGVLNFVNKRALAESSSTPPEILIKLASDESVNVRYRVALNLNTPPEAIIRLSGDGDGDVRYAVAKNSSTPPEVLMKLADDEEVVVRNAVLDNPNVTPEVLIKLAGDENVNVRYKVISNPSTPPEVLAKLAGDKNKEVRAEVVTNPSTPPEVLVRLADDESSDVRIGVADNPSTPSEVLIKLADDGYGGVRHGVAANPSTPLEILIRLADDGNRDVRYGVATNPSTPPEIIIKLSDDEDESVRYGVATNPSTPPEILIKFADGDNRDVRFGVAQNPSAPPEVLIGLADDEKRYVKREVAKNPSAPPEVLIRLGGDGDWSVREEVAENPNTPPEVFIKLGGDENINVRYEVAKNLSAPSEVLMKLAGDEYAGIREEVAKNPNTPPEALTELVGDEHGRVRRAAESSLGRINNSPINESQLLQEEYLSSEFRFGFELEGFCPPSNPRSISAESIEENANVQGILEMTEQYFGYNSGGGKSSVDKDSSISPDREIDTPFEVNSPIIEMTPRNARKLLYYLDEVQEEYEFYTNDSCGFHTHLSWPHISPMDSLWIILNFTLDQNAQKMVQRYNGTVNFMDVGYADPDVFHYMQDILRDSRGSLDEFVNILKTNRTYLRKFNLFRIHPQNTFEWRGPREFISLDDPEEAKTYVKVLYYLVEKIRKYLNSDEVYGFDRREFDSKVGDVISKKIEFQDISPTIKGRKWSKAKKTRIVGAARHAKDPELITKLFQDEKLWGMIAQNPNAPEAILQKIIDDGTNVLAVKKAKKNLENRGV